METNRLSSAVAGHVRHADGPWLANGCAQIEQACQERNEMVFVREEIPEADKHRIDFSKVHHPFHMRNTVDKYWLGNGWIIDRERDIALIPLGGGGNTPYFFLMYWQGRFIQAQLVRSFKGNGKTKDLEITWRLSFLTQLPGLPELEVIEALKAALQVYKDGDARWDDTVKAVHFDFDGTHLKNKI
jgi:hypothetical protein